MNITNQYLFPNISKKSHCISSVYCTCTEISTRTARVSLQQHTFRGHLCAKSSLDIVNKILTVRAVNPDSFPQRVLNVHLKEILD